MYFYYLNQNFMSYEAFYSELEFITHIISNFLFYKIDY